MGRLKLNTNTPIAAKISPTEAMVSSSPRRDPADYRLTLPGVWVVRWS
jgi:hypothetical protein